MLVVDQDDPKEQQRAEGLSTRLVRRAIALDGIRPYQVSSGQRRKPHLPTTQRGRVAAAARSTRRSAGHAGACGK
jgi:hypothetical protein